MGRRGSLAEQFLRALALWCLVQGTLVALLSPDLLAWDARHEHLALQQRLEAHSHPWDEHLDPAGHGAARTHAGSDMEFAPGSVGSVSLALPMLSGVGAAVPAAPLSFLVRTLPDAGTLIDSPLTTDPPPPRPLA